MPNFSFIRAVTASWAMCANSLVLFFSPLLPLAERRKGAPPARLSPIFSLLPPPPPLPPSPFLASCAGKSWPKGKSKEEEGAKENLSSFISLSQLSERLFFPFTPESVIAGGRRKRRRKLARRRKKKKEERRFFVL